MTRTVSGAVLSAPELMPYGAANVLRRRTAAGGIDATAAALAHRDLCDLAIDLYPYRAAAQRAWQLRHNLTIHDAAYVAIAELLAAPLVTLDGRIARATGPTCQVSAYPGERFVS